MLVLSRKLGEKIFIGDTICITVVDIDRGKVRLGIGAPKDLPIYREELRLHAVGGIEQRAEASRPFAEGGAE